MIVPSCPAHIPGVPSIYPTWRTGQREAVESILSSPSRFTHVHGMPGSGKTLANMAVAGLHPGRVLYLTNTRPLVAQLSAFGMAAVEGRDNYDCDDERFRTCGEGAKRCKSSSCPYRRVVRRAQDSRAVVTNYAYNAFAGSNLGDFDLVICDEAHNLEGWLSTWLEFRVDIADVRACGVNIDIDQAQWPAVLRTILPFMRERAETALAELKNLRSRGGRASLVHADKEFSRLDLLYRRIRHLVDTGWICTSATKSAGVFQPDNVAPYAERKVWRAASKVILSSASLMPSAIDSLGLAGKVDRVDLPSTFDYSRRPVIFIDDKPRVRVGRGTTEGGYSLLIDRVRAICGRHTAHKGIILSHSYDLNSRLAGLNIDDRLLTHGPGEPPPLEEFKQSTHPLVLLSPAIGEGVDLPHDACRFVIFPRVPFANHKDPLAVARNARIPTYLNDLAAVAMIQGIDRGMREERDWCMVYVVDAHWCWWAKKVRWPREVEGSFQRRLLADINLTLDNAYPAP